MGIAVGIFVIGATELEIHLEEGGGGNFAPHWTSEGVKNPGHRRVKVNRSAVELSSWIHRNCLRLYEFLQECCSALLYAEKVEA